MAYTIPRWEKWGLSTPWADMDCEEHDLVASYLERHPEIVGRYRHEEKGFRYFEILSMAEKEVKDGTADR